LHQGAQLATVGAVTRTLHEQTVVFAVMRIGGVGLTPERDDQCQLRIEPATIPTTGLRLERRWMLGRRFDGLPVLGAQRRRLPLLGPLVSGLRFDVLDELPHATV
jgi:hypothetical protein